MPTLYLWGSRDATVGQIAAERTRDYVTGAYAFELIEGAGHFLTDDAGERVITALLAFLARNESST